MAFSKTHGYKEGQELNCARCGQAVRVKLYRRGEIVDKRLIGKHALICDGCGRIFCLSCEASLRGLGEWFSKCDSCQAEITLPV